jgi:protein involved in polysaccharide export with SLBB domain
LIFLIQIGCSKEIVNKEQHPKNVKIVADDLSPDIFDYYIQPGDEIKIKYFYNPELDEEYTIRPDGKISLQLIGDLMIAGLTSSEAEELLKQKYGELYQKSLNSRYILRVEDLIEIKFFYNPELNEIVKIRPDGMVSLSLIDDIRAHGKTVTELATEIKLKYGEILQKSEVTVFLRETKASVIFPELTVVLKSNKGQPVYVGGEVVSQGPIILDGILTIADAIIKAGGFKDTASSSDIILISREYDKNIKTKRINLDKFFNALDLSENPILKPYDIVYVPKSTIAELNLFVDQYLTRMVPFNVNFGFFYRIDNKED